jgi:hypothetical protein
MDLVGVVRLRAGIAHYVKHDAAGALYCLHHLRAVIAIYFPEAEHLARGDPRLRNRDSVAFLQLLELEMLGAIVRVFGQKAIRSRGRSILADNRFAKNRLGKYGKCFSCHVATLWFYPPAGLCGSLKLLQSKDVAGQQSQAVQQPQRKDWIASPLRCSQ